MIRSPILKYRLKQGLGALGIVVSQDRPAGASLGSALTGLKKLGYDPKTVIDVGAAYGTIELYRAFPRARILAIEPMKEFAPQIEHLKRRFRVDYLPVAISDKAGTARIYQAISNDGASLRQEASAGAEDEGNYRLIETKPLGIVLEETRAEPPYFLKVDVQGAEHDVLSGAKAVLDNIEMVMLEVSFFRFKKDAPIFHETITFMHDLGFVAYSIVEPRLRPLDGAVGQCDVIFVNKNSRLWADHRYATPGQVAAHRDRWLVRLKRLAG